MYENKFKQWKRWGDRNSLYEIKSPGVYCLAISSDDLDGHKFSWLPSIAYIGMTNSRAGLKGRLKQFDNTIIGKSGHGGADRFRYKHEIYSELVNNLYLSISPFRCDVSSNEPKDLKVMGEVSKFEYDCIAEYVGHFGQMPEFNDKNRSKKYSLVHR